MRDGDRVEKSIAQFQEEIEGLKAEQAAREQQLSILDDELRGLRKLLKQGNVPRNEVLAYERKLAELGGEKGRYMANVARAEQGIGEAQLRIGQLRKAAREEIVAELRAVQERIFGLEERLVAARDVLGRTEIRAPARGIVMALQAHTTGGVIAPGRSPASARDARRGAHQDRYAHGAGLHAVPSHGKLRSCLQGTISTPSCPLSSRAGDSMASSL